MFSLRSYGGAPMIVFDLADAELRKQGVIERIQKLKGELEVTLAAIGRAQVELGRVESDIDSLKSTSGDEAAIHTEQVRTGPGPSRLTNPSRTDVADACLELISRAEKPLSRAELFDGLAERGLAIDGQNPLMVFSTMLWRERSRIARLRGYGYWPADKAYPPASYYPAEPTLI
jgi:hypothetical protein